MRLVLMILAAMVCIVSAKPVLADATADYQAAGGALKRGDLEAAAGFMIKVVTAKDASPAMQAQAHFTLGALAHQKGDLPRAVAEYSLALVQDPAFPAALGNRANALYLMGRKDDALKDFNEAVRLAPQAPETYANRGYYFLSEKAPDKALDDLNKAISLNPNMAEAYVNRGMAYFSLGDQDKALADFDRAVALKPNYALAYKNRGELWQKRGEAARAKADLDKAAQLLQTK